MWLIDQLNIKLGSQTTVSSLSGTWKIVSIISTILCNETNYYAHEENSDDYNAFCRSLRKKQNKTYMIHTKKNKKIKL